MNFGIQRDSMLLTPVYYLCSCPVCSQLVRSWTLMILVDPFQLRYSTILYNHVNQPCSFLCQCLFHHVHQALNVTLLCSHCSWSVWLTFRIFSSLQVLMLPSFDIRAYTSMQQWAFPFLSPNFLYWATSNPQLHIVPWLHFLKIWGSWLQTLVFL